MVCEDDGIFLNKTSTYMGLIPLAILNLHFFDMRKLSKKNIVIYKPVCLLSVPLTVSVCL